MNLAWQRFTLSGLPLKEYLRSSFLHRCLVGVFGSWRQGSILLQSGDAIAAALISLVYALAPFVSTALIGLLLVACVGIWLLLTISDDTQSSDFLGVTPIHIPVFIFWGTAVIATALSPVKAAARSDLITFTLYLCLFAFCARVLRSPRIRSWLITLYLHVSLIVSIYGLQQKFSGAAQLATWVDPESPLSKNVRVYSYLGNPNLLGGYLLPAVILSLIAIFAWRGLPRKALAITMFVVNLACFRFTDSRGAFIGLAAAIIALVFILPYWYKEYLPQFWRKWLLPMLIGGFVGLVVAALVFSNEFRLRIFSIFAGREDSSNNFRMNVWTGVFKMIGDYPVFGIGPGHNSFNKVYPLYQLPRYTALSAYSIFLEIIVETGFVGFASFIWLLIVTFNAGLIQLQRLRQLKNSDGLWLIGAIVTMVGMLAHGLVDTVWYRPQINTLWWLMVAIVASYYMPLRQTRKQGFNSPNPNSAGY